MGFQEPAPRPGPRRQGIVPAWFLAAAVLAVVGWWIYERRQVPVAPPVEVTAEVEPLSAAALSDGEAEEIVHLQQMLRQAQRDLLDQQETIESLERQLQEARADAELHKRGLERAVEELNRINDDIAKLEEASRALPRAAPVQPPVERVRPLGAPFVTTTLNGWVVASGLVHNPTRETVRGTLEVSLAGSGGIIDTRGFLMSIGPGETERYDITFTNIFPTERLGAKATWVP